MIVINTVNAERFSLNGIEYFKNFTPVVAGDTISILNTYGNCIDIVKSTNYANFTVNGLTFLNVASLQGALLPVVYTRNTLGSVGGGSRMMKFNFASLILSTTVNQWRTGNYNSSTYSDAVRNNVTGANPVANVNVGAQHVYKTGTITKIILKSIRSGAVLNIDAKFHIGKFEKPDGEVGYLNEIQVAQESFVESSASFGIGFIKEMTIANASVTEGDFIYFAVANNTTTATTLLGFEATLIIE